jgi:hypothetical protein
MSLLNSKFDITSIDNPLAVAALAQVLKVTNGETFSSQGTPVAGVIPAGTIVTMDHTTGCAVVATTPNISSADKELAFVVIDGNMDFSGSFVQKLTVLHGGFTMETDQYVAGGYTPGLPVSFGVGGAGKISLLTAPTTEQLFGYVGPAGLDSVNGILQVVVPQGCGL